MLRGQVFDGFASKTGGGGGGLIEVEETREEREEGRDRVGGLLGTFPLVRV